MNSDVDFILGEDRHVKLYVHSVKDEYVAIASASYELLLDGDIEDSGSCVIDGQYIDMKLNPLHKSRAYILEVTCAIADEVRKKRLSIGVK